MKLYADTKFEVGQTVYRVYETRKNIEQKATCDVCLGTGKITYKGYKCNCPKCNGRGELVTDSKGALEKELFATIEEAQTYCDEEATNDACKAFALENCKGY